MNMMETIKKAQQVGVKVKELQEELQNTEVEATAADGQVTVTVSGAQVPLEVTVSEELLAKGAEAVSEAGAHGTRARGRVRVGRIASRLVLACRAVVPHAVLRVRRSELGRQGGAQELYGLRQGPHVRPLR